MIDTPEILQLAPRHIALLPVSVPHAELKNVMGPGLRTVKAAVAAQGLAIGGAWFAHHLSMAGGIFDLAIGVPVESPFQPDGKVLAGEWPAMRAAQTIYHGDYAGLFAAWSEFNDWVKASGGKPAPDLWECYLAGPEAGADPAQWRTQLIRPLVA